MIIKNTILLITIVLMIGCSTFQTKNVDPEILLENRKIKKEMQNQCVKDHTFTYRLFNPEHAHNWPVWGKALAWIGPGH